MNQLKQFQDRFGAKLMAMEFIVNSEVDLHQVSGFVCDHLESGGKPLKVKITGAGKRSLSQNAFQHAIYRDISKYLIAKGRSEWDPKFVKKNLKNKFLGWEDEEYIDIKTGERTCKSVLRSTAALSPGEAYHFTTAILEWSESIGCYIDIPSSCEYRDLMEQQND